MFLLLSIISFLPIVLLGIYIYKKDSVKEPKSLLMGLFASGFLAAILVVIVNLLLILIMPHLYLSGDYSQFSFFELFILVFLEVALVEEFMKWIMIRFIGYPHKDFDQIYDIIVYAVFVALGFAAIENFFYVIEGGITLGIYRAILSVPGHVCFGVFMGYYLGLAKLNEKTNRKKYVKNMILSILVPAIFHAIYNFCLMTENLYFLLIFSGFIILIYVSAARKINRLSKIEDNINDEFNDNI